MLTEPQHLGRTAIKRSAWAGGRFENRPGTEHGNTQVRKGDVRGGLRVSGGYELLWGG